MGVKGLRHNGWEIKKPPFFVGGFIFFSVFVLLVRDFGEPPMGYCVLGNKGQNDGNKGNGYDVEHWVTDAGQAAYRHELCQPSVSKIFRYFVAEHVKTVPDPTIRP